MGNVYTSSTPVVPNVANRSEESKILVFQNSPRVSNDPNPTAQHLIPIRHDYAIILQKQGHNRNRPPSFRRRACPVPRYGAGIQSPVPANTRLSTERLSPLSSSMVPVATGMAHCYENRLRQTRRRGNPCDCPFPAPTRFHPLMWPSQCHGHFEKRATKNLQSLPRRRRDLLSQSLPQRGRDTERGVFVIQLTETEQLHTSGIACEKRAMRLAYTLEERWA